MTKNQKKKAIIIIGIIVAIVLIFFIIRTITNSGEDKPEGTQTNQTQVQEFVERQEDGTKLNTSDELKKTKVLGDLEFTDIKLTSKNGESFLTAKVKNTGISTAGDEFIKITILDKSGAILNKINVYLGTIDAGKETTISSKVSSDFVNAYDFEISR